MTTAEKIGKLGFQRWYERTLVEAHLYLVTCLLGIILALAALEIINASAGLAHAFFKIVVATAGAVLAAYGLQRYLAFMVFAQRMSDKAVCPQCGQYAAFDVISSGPKTHESEVHPKDFWLKAKCRQCGKGWTL
jgi:hypothetical protein